MFVTQSGLEPRSLVVSSADRGLDFVAYDASCMGLRLCTTKKHTTEQKKTPNLFPAFSEQFLFLEVNKEDTTYAYEKKNEVNDRGKEWVRRGMRGDACG
jgi:hypothetical protein